MHKPAHHRIQSKITDSEISINGNSISVENGLPWKTNAKWVLTDKI
jgi:hypothetical protein